VTAQQARSGPPAAAGEAPDPPDPPGDPEAVARIICLRLLDQRARSRAELATALRRKGVPAQAAGAVLDRFTEVGLINDADLANGYALTQHEQRGLAGRAVALRLRRRGLDEAVVRAAVDQIDPDSERATAQRLVARKLATLGGLEPQVRARRLVSLLARRGYPAGLAHEVVRAALADAELTELGEAERLP
jgi:regulatory protein